MYTLNAYSDFSQSIANAGIPVPSSLIQDGNIHRYSTNGDHSDKSGWYVFHYDHGAFGDWRSDTNGTWSAKTGSKHEYDPELAAKIAQSKKEYEEQQRRDVALNQRQAIKLWDSAKPCDNHPYLVKKNISGYGLRSKDSTLLVPVYNDQHELIALQRIYFDDASNKFEKRFLGKLSHGFYPIGVINDGDKIYICEGYATGASVYGASGVATVVAFNAGNLESVATILRSQFPKSLITIAADDDWKTVVKGKPYNSGIEHAIKAAQAVGGTYCLPVFDSNRGDKDSDFNDLGDPFKIAACLKLEITPPAAILPNTYPVPEITNYRSLADCRNSVGMELLNAFDNEGTYLHIGSPGVGKTQALLNLPTPNPSIMLENYTGYTIEPGQQIVILEPTLAKCDELASVFNRDHGVAMVIRGRDKTDPKTNEPMCKRADLIRDLHSKGLGVSIKSLLCKRKISNAKHEYCPHSHDCHYIRQEREKRRSPIHITTHVNAFSNHTSMWRKARALIIDESPLNTAVVDFHADIAEFRVKHPALELLVSELEKGNSLAGNEELAAALMEFGKDREKVVSEKPISPSLDDASLLEAIQLLPVNNIPVSWYAAVDKAIAMCKKERFNGLLIENDKLWGDWIKQPVIEARSTIALDGTGNPETWSAILGKPVTVIGTATDKADYNITVTQEISKSMYKAHWLKDKDSTELQPHIIGMILAVEFDGVIAQKALIDALRPFLPATVKLSHFNANRGLNAMENCQNLLVIGRVEPSAKSVERIARALNPNKVIEAPGQYKRAKGVGNSYIHYHPDPYCQAVLIQIRDAEVIQAIARIRPFKTGNTRKVVVFNTIPLDHVFNVESGYINFPTAAFRVLGNTGQGDVLPLSKSFFESQGLTHEEVDEIARYFVRSGQTSLPVVEYRLKGSHGGINKKCIVLSTIEKASEQLTKLHDGAVIEFPKLIPDITTDSISQDLAGLLPTDSTNKELPHKEQVSLTGGVPLIKDILYKTTPPVNERDYLQGYSVSQDSKGYYSLKRKVNNKTETIYIGKELNPEIVKRKLGVDIAKDTVTIPVSIPLVQSKFGVDTTQGLNVDKEPVVNDAAISIPLVTIPISTPSKIGIEKYNGCEGCLYNQLNECAMWNRPLREIRCARYKTERTLWNGVPEVIPMTAKYIAHLASQQESLHEVLTPKVIQVSPPPQNLPKRYVAKTANTDTDKINTILNSGLGYGYIVTNNKCNSQLEKSFIDAGLRAFEAAWISFNDKETVDGIPYASKDSLVEYYRIRLCDPEIKANNKVQSNGDFVLPMSIAGLIRQHGNGWLLDCQQGKDMIVANKEIDKYSVYDL